MVLAIRVSGDGKVQEGFGEFNSTKMNEPSCSYEQCHLPRESFLSYCDVNPLPENVKMSNITRETVSGVGSAPYFIAAARKSTGIEIGRRSL